MTARRWPRNEGAEPAEGNGRAARFAGFSADTGLSMRKGKPHVLSDGGMHQELCIAAQVLWRSDKEFAQRAFDRLTEIDDGFYTEWESVRSCWERRDLANAATTTSATPQGIDGPGIAGVS